MIANGISDLRPPHEAAFWSVHPASSSGGRRGNRDRGDRHGRSDGSSERTPQPAGCQAAHGGR